MVSLKAPRGGANLPWRLHVLAGHAALIGNTAPETWPEMMAVINAANAVLKRIGAKPYGQLEEKK